MNIDQVDRLADHVVLPGLAAVVARSRSTTAEELAFIAVATERKLYLPEGYSSMFAYCVGELGFSEDATFKRTQAAGVGRKHPAIFAAVADGRLHLSAVVLLAPHLTQVNAAELIAGASRKTKSQIECLLAERFPKPDVPTRVRAIASVATAVSPAPGQVKLSAAPPVGELVLATTNSPAPGQVKQSPAPPAAEMVLANTNSPAPGQVESPAPRPRITPLAPQRFSWQLTVAGSTNDKLRYARELLGHSVPNGEVAEVLDRALDALIVTLEKRIFAAGSRTRPGRGSDDPRHVPAAVKHEVWVRDGGRCTFASDKGHRCESRTRLEYDHVDPVARGGCATVAGMRLLCAGHNQHAAELTLGKVFMRKKREAARSERQGSLGRGTPPALLPTAALEVVPRLRKLGLTADEARRAAARAAEARPEATVDELVGYAMELAAPVGSLAGIDMQCVQGKSVHSRALGVNVSESARPGKQDRTICPVEVRQPNAQPGSTRECAFVRRDQH